MQIELLVKLWTDTIVDLSTAHDHATRTEADSQTDELLAPLLTAPVSQIREFIGKLATALREDNRVPWMAWSMFQKIVEPVILTAPDGNIIQLKKDLAYQVAELAEKNLDRADLVLAMAGALQWRPSDQLQAVKEGIEKGEKPRIKGRQSCLFLETKDAYVVL